jgi:hypothetical protein
MSVLQPWLVPLGSVPGFLGWCLEALGWWIVVQQAQAQVHFELEVAFWSVCEGEFWLAKVSEEDYTRVHTWLYQPTNAQMSPVYFVL